MFSQNFIKQLLFSMYILKGNTGHIICRQLPIPVVSDKTWVKFDINNLKVFFCLT